MALPVENEKLQWSFSWTLGISYASPTCLFCDHAQACEADSCVPQIEAASGPYYIVSACHGSSSWSTSAPESAHYHGNFSGSRFTESNQMLRISKLGVCWRLMIHSGRGNIRAATAVNKPHAELEGIPWVTGGETFPYGKSITSLAKNKRRVSQLMSNLCRAWRKRGWVACPPPACSTPPPSGNHSVPPLTCLDHPPGAHPAAQLSPTSPCLHTNDGWICQAM